MSNLKLMVLKSRDVLIPGKDAVSESVKVYVNSSNYHEASEPSKPYL